MFFVLSKYTIGCYNSFMTFDKLNNSFPESRENKIKVIKERTEIIGELISLGEQNNNSLTFKDSGLNDKLEQTKNIKIKEEVLKGLNEESIDLIKYSLEIFKSFLRGPIFTDNFGFDHPSRRKWETTHVEKGKLSPEAKEYYYSNRLNTNRGWSGVITELKELEGIIINSNIKNKLDNLKSKISREFFDKYYEVQDRVNVEIYNKLSKDAKVKIVEELTEIVREIIVLLEEKDK